MTRSSKKWRKLSAGEFQSFWETPKDKDGNSHTVEKKDWNNEEIFKQNTIL